MPTKTSTNSITPIMISQGSSFLQILLNSSIPSVITVHQIHKKFDCNKYNNKREEKFPKPHIKHFFAPKHFCKCFHDIIEHIRIIPACV